MRVMTKNQTFARSSSIVRNRAKNDVKNVKTQRLFQRPSVKKFLYQSSNLKLRPKLNPKMNLKSLPKNTDLSKRKRRRDSRLVVKRNIGQRKVRKKTPSLCQSRPISPIKSSTDTKRSSAMSSCSRRSIEEGPSMMNSDSINMVTMLMATQKSKSMITIMNKILYTGNNRKPMPGNKGDSIMSSSSNMTSSNMSSSNMSSSNMSSSNNSMSHSSQSNQRSRRSQRSQSSNNSKK